VSGHLEQRQLSAFDQLDAATRRPLLEHARGCSACRKRLLAADPARLFALLGLDPIPEHALARLSARVDAVLDEQPGPARRRVRRRAIAFGSMAASLLLAGIFGGYLLDRDLRDPAVAAAPLALPEVAWMEPLGQAPPVAGMQLVSSPGEAQVVDLNIGETQVLMIFDEALDL
jgi:hypothetical protein